MRIISQLQSLSLTKKKILLWGIVIVVSIVMLLFWIRSAKEKLNTAPKNGFQEIMIPPIDIPQMPEMDIAIPPELQKELEDELQKQNNEENKTN